MTEIALDMAKMTLDMANSTTSNAFSLRKLSGSTQQTPRKGLCFVCCIHRNTPLSVSPATVFLTTSNA